MKISISLYETEVFVLILVLMFGLEKNGFHCRNERIQLHTLIIELSHEYTSN